MKDWRRQKSSFVAASLLCQLTGREKPEAFSGDLVGMWSRRINEKDRLVYHVEEETETITVLQCRRHYSDR
ncbi:MAG: Txe/YoeB family addiction module toxin [Victivallales bacterium]|nr:Txe/YoeB family addiction module toxin [Victivallales bacterium]